MRLINNITSKEKFEMHLSESLVWALEYEDILVVKVFCDGTVKKKGSKSS